MSDSKKLTFQLTEEQMKAIKPLVEATGRIKMAGEVEGDQFKVSFLACNMAFMACNSPFVISDGTLKTKAK
ncbi:hypothetical protein [Sinorhizobium terangae]|uniref:hypothetical protein n=1 Tax=Sinorhizobium terangae TaxID=110322 RepID=UPI0024B19806|nr:hypothetical protein [Sinorhizobium terangae]WFU49166.1 hypothetical protein QA637_07140 [Sinorhizobium terangae]